MLQWAISRLVGEEETNRPWRMRSYDLELETEALTPIDNQPV